MDAPPQGVEEALEVVAGFDEALTHGFARLAGDQLRDLAGALAGTPIGQRAAEAAEKIAAGSIAEEHLTALAGGRAALLGAVHDALLSQLDTAMGRRRAEHTAGDGASEAAAGCRSWLAELAITGWKGVDHDLVSASAQPIEALLSGQGTRRLAVLLDGLAAELSASCPVATMERLPRRRWADLWSRALLLSQGGWPEPVVEEVSGTLLILGVDVQEHGTAVQVQVHGVLDERLVRTSVTVAKVDTIVGLAVWPLLSGYPKLVRALAEQRAVEVKDLPLLGGGDLVWHEDRATLKDPVDPFVTARVALAGAVAPAVPPLERHPVRIAEPVLVEGDLSGYNFDRLTASGPITEDVLKGASACVGLMRWDGGQWTLQPLAVRKGKKQPHNAELALSPKAAKAGDAVTVLKERAGRLLRK
ncbi:hypothetical protein [Nonomuraea africana]|uniref:DUF222 domain-containing protein n=1 Tax=Nonomuraea africana TaxID=46171 RepID=A0ABR9KS38_9ACTN|nr:hypothetical protein [Nonomuraea africana]MBE1564418.1 hypothetical protein [Nonomuraea africana]